MFLYTREHVWTRVFEARASLWGGGYGCESRCCFSSDSTGGFLLQLQLQLCWTLVDLRERLSSTLGYQLICNFSPFGLLLAGVYSSYYYQLLLSFQL